MGVCFQDAFIAWVLVQLKEFCESGSKNITSYDAVPMIFYLLKGPIAIGIFIWMLIGVIQNNYLRILDYACYSVIFAVSTPIFIKVYRFTQEDKREAAAKSKLKKYQKYTLRR
ncbi:hypothetical protein FGO68_gene3173 [Halteria grandinella]|uniref:Uncharacterized protein n=1 Tax=Halteria grandinella TaxID=5974 RepID=A0A8J8T0X5_HALGN|nr:hypothetical protein FGO68_gene3173 [Halteria grandinella]